MNFTKKIALMVASMTLAAPVFYGENMITTHASSMRFCTRHQNNQSLSVYLGRQLCQQPTWQRHLANPWQAYPHQTVLPHG